MPSVAISYDGSKRHMSGYFDCGPIAQLAGTKLVQTGTISSAVVHKILAKANADLLVAAGWSQMISNETLGIARLGGVELHSTPLPVGWVGPLYRQPSFTGCERPRSRCSI